MTSRNRPLKIALILMATTVAIAALLALIFLIVGQALPEANSARIQWGSHSTTLHGAFTSGALEFLLAWSAVTLAILFAVAVTLFVLAVTGFALGFSALIVSLPLILVGLFAWWMIRRSNRATAAPAASPSSPTPQA